MKLLDALMSPILFYASEVWGIDCNGQLEKDPAKLVQNKFLKWVLILVVSVFYFFLSSVNTDDLSPLIF